MVPMTTAQTLQYPQPDDRPRRRSRRTTIIVSAVVIVLTLIVSAAVPAFARYRVPRTS